MHRSGHYGMNIFLSAPIVAIFLFIGYPFLAVFFFVSVAAFPMIPDIDQNYTSKYAGYIGKLQFYMLYPLFKLTGFFLPAGESAPEGFSDVSHRGISHTIQFSVVFACAYLTVLSGIGLTLYTLMPIEFTQLIQSTAPAFVWVITIFVAGFCTVFFHILGDTFTPTGINYTSRSSSYGYSFDKFYAKNEIANETAALMGFGAVILSLLIFQIESLLYMVGLFVGGYISLLIIWLLLITTRVGNWIYMIFLK